MHLDSKKNRQDILAFIYLTISFHTCELGLKLNFESNEYTKEHIKKQKNKSRKTKRNQMRRFHFSLLQEAQTLRVLKPLSFQQLDRPICLKTRYSLYQCTLCYPLHLLHWHAELFCNVRGTWWNLSSVCRFIF